jgi:hypothetical protein
MEGKPLRPGKRLDPNVPPPEEADAPAEATSDATLGGYITVHNRPPAFEGSDGQPYSVSIETERTSNLRAPWGAYLVFPKWAETGVGVVGHVETPVLWEGISEKEAVSLAGEAPLEQVKQLLDEAIARRTGAEDEPW